MEDKKKEKAFYGWETARFHLNFPNGNRLSTIWGEGSYTDEYDSHSMTAYLLGETKERPVFNSNTAEIMFTCPEKLKKKILKKYNEGSDDPIGHLPINKWIEIINLLAK